MFLNLRKPLMFKIPNLPYKLMAGHEEDHIGSSDPNWWFSDLDLQLRFCKNFRLRLPMIEVRCGAVKRRRVEATTLQLRGGGCESTVRGVDAGGERDVASGCIGN